MSTWLPKAHAIEKTDLKTLEDLGFEWIVADEKFMNKQDECILLGFYVHPDSDRSFAAIVVKDPVSIIGKKYLYYFEALKCIDESVLVAGAV